MLTAQQTDEQLLLACRRGDEEAWEIVRCYQRLIMLFRAGWTSTKTRPPKFFRRCSPIPHFRTFKRLSNRTAFTHGLSRRPVARRGASFVARKAFVPSMTGKSAKTRCSRLRTNAFCRTQRRTIGATAPCPHGSRRIGRASPGNRRRIFSTNRKRDLRAITLLRVAQGSIGPTRARCLKKLMDVLSKKGLAMR